MIITISVVVTCIILIGVTIYMIVKDYLDRENTRIWMRRRMRRMSDSLLQMEQEVEALKTDVKILKDNEVQLASNLDEIINDEINAIENKTELALLSVQTIQNGFLQNFDAQEDNM